MVFGPGEKGTEIRWAYLNGSPTKLFIDQPDHWDYIGVWAPDGDRFYFTSYPSTDGPEDFVHYLSTNNTQPTNRDWSKPQWSADSKRMVWTIRQKVRQFWLLDGL